MTDIVKPSKRLAAGVAASLLLMVTISGCGGADRPSLVNVTGKVTLDEAPLEGAQVALLYQGDQSGKYARPSRATTNAQGEFTPQTYADDAGLPTGKYKVAVIKKELVGELPENYNIENPDSSNLKYKWVTPMYYGDPKTSGLEIEVTSSGIEPEVIALTTDGQKPEIETTGPKMRANEP